MRRGGVDQNLIQGAKILAGTQGTGGVTLGGAITSGVTGAIDEVFNDPSKRAKFQERIRGKKGDPPAPKEDETQTPASENNQGVQNGGNTGDASVDIMNAVNSENSGTSEESDSNGSPANMLRATPIKMLFQANKNKYK